MNVLIACEESQRVCKEFRKKGHQAFSCDMVKCSGGHPEWHIVDDIRCIMNGGLIRLQNQTKMVVDKLYLIIANPPCTYLSNAATSRHSLTSTPLNKINGRTLSRIESMRLFMDIAMANCNKIAIENPVGIMNTAYRKPDQIIEPYYFAESEEDFENYTKKRTCLWLKNLKPLVRTNDLKEPNLKELYGTYSNGKPKNWTEGSIGKIQGVSNSTCRSKTFKGIAKAMADQWG